MQNGRIISSSLVAMVALLSLDAKTASSQPTDPRDPFYAARQVFVGSERDMPLDGRYRFAIQPPVSNNGDLVVPDSVIAALREMRRALPHWFLDALRQSAGNYECSVTVNNQGYTSLVTAWVWQNWIEPHLPLRRDFERLGANLRNDLTIRNAFVNGLCELVKTDDEARAMLYLTEHLKFELVQ